jgi:S1-C subfamily serine protease
MDIERLTKTQIILLTLLVSFVTSIATGIVTVTLMDQAPPAITQTINRVVERTIETVVPDKSQSASVITKEVTVVVKEEDLITDSIEKNSKSVVKIREMNADGETSRLVGLGIIVSSDGIIATDLSVIKNDQIYIIETASGERFNTNVLIAKSENPSIFLAIEIPTVTIAKGEGKKEIVFSPVTLSSANVFKPGQTVISLTGEERIDVVIGIISGLVEDKISTSTSTAKTALSVIKTNINEKDIFIGSPLINIFGEVIGISTHGSVIGKTALFKPVSEIKSMLSDIQANKKDSEEALAE